MRRKPRNWHRECDNCWGCGKICNRCEYPVNACVEMGNCEDLDDEDMRDCDECPNACGTLDPEVKVVPKKKKPVRSKLN